MPKVRVIKFAAVSSEKQKENISLDEQNRLLDKIIAEHDDWVVIDSLVVDGHSRSDADIFTVFEEHAKQGCFAYHTLRAHWLARDFDVLVAVDETRVCRSPGGYGVIVGSIIQSGARVYLLGSGWVDSSNEEYSIALGGMKASASIRLLKKLRPAGIARRVEEGKAITTPARGHKYVYDERGKPKQVYVEGFGLSWLIVDESWRPLWNAILELLQKRIAWGKLEIELAKRGFINPETSKPYPFDYFYHIIRNPAFWGHRAVYLKGVPVKMWMLDPNEPRPDPKDDPAAAKVIIKYHVHPAIWQGKQGEIALALMRDKKPFGRAVQHGKSYPYTGLLICNTCGRTLNVSSSSRGKYRKFDRYKCATRVQRRGNCNQTKTIRFDSIQSYIDDLLSKAIARRDITFLVGRSDQDTQRTKLTDLERQLEAAKRRRLRLISDQANADLDAHDDYASFIKQEGVKIRELTDQRDRIQQTIENVSVNLTRERTFHELRENGITWLWQQDDVTINTYLRRLMGNSRFVVDQGVITGVVTI